MFNRCSLCTLTSNSQEKTTHLPNFQKYIDSDPMSYTYLASFTNPADVTLESGYWFPLSKPFKLVQMPFTKLPWYISTKIVSLKRRLIIFFQSLIPRIIYEKKCFISFKNCCVWVCVSQRIYSLWYWQNFEIIFFVNCSYKKWINWEFLISKKRRKGKQRKKQNKINTYKQTERKRERERENGR